MIKLDATTKSLEVDLDAAIATNQLPVYASYTDVDQTNLIVENVSSNDTQTNSTTAVTIVAAPASGDTRKVDFISVYNADTAARNVTIQLNNNSTLRILVKETLQPGETLQYADGEGWSVANRKKISASIEASDSPSIDGFGRWRVSNPETIFDSKLIFDDQPLFWDESLETGAGITSAHSTDTASTVITSTVSTAGKFTRQTFMRFNYQPGKSQLILMTGVLDLSGGGTGVQRRIGYFDDDNGIFFEDNEGTVRVVRRTNVTGSAVDNTVAQSSWNLDVMDGSGPSGVTIDWEKAQIFFIDLEWLGVGRARMGLVIDGIPIYVHQFLNANSLSTVYMSSPNLPLRYQMVTTASSPASTMECICTTVISEGGAQKNGILRYKSTAGTHVDLAVENTLYAIVGIRLKSAYIAEAVVPERITVIDHKVGSFYEWVLLFNPTVGGTFTYSNETNSAVQTATGATANTVTGGTVITGGHGSTENSTMATASVIPDARRLGAAIDGTVDEIVLAVRPIGGTVDLEVEGSINWRELS